MSKYDALGRFLKEQKLDLVPMSFREIEKITGTKLPASKRYPAWWSNNAWNNVMTKVWLEAGYRSEQVDISHERVVFRREQQVESRNRTAPIATKSAAHPILGALKGTFTIEPNWDLTQPALDSDEQKQLEETIDRTADLVDAGLRGGR
jgi:hypothetical protein